MQYRASRSQSLGSVSDYGEVFFKKKGKTALYIHTPRPIMCSNQVKRDQGRVPFTHLLRRAVIGAQGDSKTNNERKHDTTESLGVARDILRSMERKTTAHLRHSINISMVYKVKIRSAV